MDLVYTKLSARTVIKIQWPDKTKAKGWVKKTLRTCYVWKKNHILKPIQYYYTGTQ